MKLSIVLLFFLCLHGYSVFGQDYDQLRSQLEEILEKDQKERVDAAAMSKKYKPDSKEMKEIVKKIMAQDSVNLPIVTHILDTYGWIGRDKIGSKANSALFLVIQHADLKTQEKYLPMLRKAVQEGNTQPGDLALMEDRVAIRQGKKQIYGSQIGQDTLSGTFYVLPLEDPSHVDTRRARMGLPPMSEYVKEFGIVWKPKAENPPMGKEDMASQKESQLCDENIDFTKVDLPNLDFVFSPVYLSNNKLAGFILTINPAHFTSYTITCMDGKPVGEKDYRYDKKKGIFLVKVDGVTSEEQLYPTTLIIDGKGYSFYSFTKWYNFKKL